MGADGDGDGVAVGGDAVDAVGVAEQLGEQDLGGAALAVNAGALEPLSGWMTDARLAGRGRDRGGGDEGGDQRQQQGQHAR
jgi:hypothetical protein